MSQRTAKFVSAIFASALAGIPLATTSRGETVTPDSCLSSPKGETPQGSHWYYRIEHGTMRHCWYLREASERVSQSSPQNILPPAKPPAPAAPPASVAAQHSPADARAEVPPQASRDDGPTAAPLTAPARANDAVRTDGSGASSSTAILASRWPDPSGAIPPTGLQQPANSNSTSNTPVESTLPPAPVDAAVIPADPDSASHGERGIMPILVAILGALTLTAAAIAKFGRPRRLRPRIVRGRRGPIWETTDDDRIVLSDYPGTNAHMRRPRFARSVGEADDRKSESYRRKSTRARA
jgi:hypothetical protein